MNMIKIHAGKLRAIGYDISTRNLRVELDSGNALEYSGIGQNIWQNLKTSANQWSYYRDNIEEAYSSRSVSIKPTSGGKNPLDDLFK